ncbi:MAG: efflux RND transporter permease subunit [Bryobacteraceae bacterium]|nr:efflux RND transporter permease subunit [Bryobacteraceae bacterium]
MWIVKLALNRPYTFVVMALLISILGGLSIYSMPTDIFPDIDLPVASVIWAYGGMSPEDVEKRIVTSTERAITTTVNDVEHIESQSVPGYGVIRVYFHPTVKIDMAIAQLTAITASITRVLPPGIFPPFVLRYNAATVPILQLALSSKTLNEQQVADLANTQLRIGLATVQGASVPLPYGGKFRQIMVDLDPAAMQSRRLSAVDVSAAINAQNLILPAGTAKIGTREYNVKLNASPELVEQLNNLPVKSANGATVYVRDVAQVHDGFAVQSNVVRQNGTRGALLTILKNGSTSTLTIIDRVQKALDRIQTLLPKEMEVKRMFDQSIFVRAAIDNVVHEGLLAGGLTGLMILLFLGSWRSTLIVCISIPLSILSSLFLLNVIGHTINVMTLGGLALAVGILVDDATVEIENIHRNLHERKPLLEAILDGAQQIAVPTFVSTLCICIVFLPVIFLTGAARFLFTPLAYAVVFAMLASYLLSRTVIPTLVRFLLKNEAHVYQQEHPVGQGPIWALHGAFNHGFLSLQRLYRRMLNWSLDHPGTVVASFVLLACTAAGLSQLIGRDFFPQVDAGLIRMHLRAPSGLRIEETEEYFSRVEASIRRQIPAREIDTILDNIGLPIIGLNLAYSDSNTIGRSDGEILISLKPGHGPTEVYVRDMRRKLKDEFPDCEFFFQPADMVGQILNFGLPAPIDIQITSRNPRATLPLAREIERRVAAIPGAVDVHLHQVTDAPDLKVNVDRTKAEMVGLTQRDVANALLVTLSSSGQVSPNYWIDPANGVNYSIAVQAPPIRLESFDDIANTPISGAGGGVPQLLRNLSVMERGQSWAVVNHWNVQPVLNIYAGVEGRDLGGVAGDVQKIVDSFKKKLPRGTLIDVRGQVETMNSSFIRLGAGLIFAILLVYLLMVVNFQSWLDPFIILMALPGALSGIIWMLFLSQTSFSVPSLMGAIMSIGVATANSILMITFANDQRHMGFDARSAALEAGTVRLRPVLMTAFAMVIGMLPMSLGVGEGGEQNAPLGRAVIGGLVLATVATLFLVPVTYRLLRQRAPKKLEWK